MRSADRLDHSNPSSDLAFPFRARHSATAASTLRALALHAARSSHLSPLKHSLLHTACPPPSRAGSLARRGLQPLSYDHRVALGSTPLLG
jgi:hypothetical protein